MHVLLCIRLAAIALPALQVTPELHKQSPDVLLLTCTCRTGMLTLALYLRHACELGFMIDAVAVV